MLWSLILAFCLALASILVAFRCGGAPERAGAWILSMMLIVPRAVHWVYDKQFNNVDPAGFGTDILALGGFVLIALKARRYWPLWVSSLQLLSVAAHLVRWFDVMVEPLVYAVMSGAPSYLISISLMSGALLHRRRQIQSGARRSWLSSSPRSTPKTPT